jgi:hypothetical protein
MPWKKSRSLSDANSGLGAGWRFRHRHFKSMPVAIQLFPLPGDKKEETPAPLPTLSTTASIAGHWPSKALSLTIPPTLRAVADEVVEARAARRRYPRFY